MRFAILSLVLFLIAGCGGLEPSARVPKTAVLSTSDVLPISAAIASTPDRRLVVRGFVFERAGQTRLCETLREAFPPQCAPSSLTVVNSDALPELDYDSYRDVRWSRQPVALYGLLAGDTLRIIEHSE